jgi:hypothetical protein
MVHVVVPGKILMFGTPCPDLPESCTWQDVDGRRHFSAEFYADLLQELGVSVVIRAEAAEYDPAPFTRRGIAVEDLEPPGQRSRGGGALTLQALDRFLALLACASGSVALHCGSRPAFADALLSAYLLRRRLFADPAGALSWLSIARPGPHAPVPAEVLATVLPGRLADLLPRSASFDAGMVGDRDRSVAEDSRSGGKVSLFPVQHWLPSCRCTSTGQRTLAHSHSESDYCGGGALCGPRGHGLSSLGDRLFSSSPDL